MSKKTDAKKKKVLGIYIEDEVKKKIAALAKSNHRSVSAQAALMLEKCLINPKGK